MLIKTIIVVGVAVFSSVAAASAQVPSTAPNMDYFYSGTYQGGVTGGNTTGTTGTQGVVGNPNCPQPVEPGGIRPLNWSCPTGTQGVSNNLVAQALNQRSNSPRTQTGNTTQTQQTPGQRAMQRQTSQQTPGQQAMWQHNSGRVRVANDQTENTGGGSAVNQQLQSAFAQRNNGGRQQWANLGADYLGQRRVQAGSQQSNWGRQYGYGMPAQNSANRGLGRGQFSRYSRR